MMETEKLSSIFNQMDIWTLVQLLVIASVAGLLISLSQRVLPFLANHLFGRLRLLLLASVPLARLFILVTAFCLAIPLIVEPSLQNMVALFGSIGLALGFALKDYASSLIAGIVAVYEMPYRNGDWVEIAGTYGEVRHVGMRTVQIVTPDDTVVFIPHLKIWQELVFNANSGHPHLQCVASFYLMPQENGSLVRQILKDVAYASPYLNPTLPVVVVVTEKFGGTEYKLKAYPIDGRQQFQFISDLSVLGMKSLLGAGLSPARIPFP